MTYLLKHVLFHVCRNFFDNNSEYSDYGRNAAVMKLPKRKVKGDDFDDGDLEKGKPDAKKYKKKSSP